MLSSCLVMKDCTFTTFSVPANSGVAKEQTFTFTDNVYPLFAFVKYTSSNGLYAYSCNLSGGSKNSAKIYIQVRNVTNSSINCAAVATVLCFKNG